MIYGDADNTNAGAEQAAKLLVPDILAIRQSSNLYVYVLNNPVKNIDSSGKSVSAIFAGSWSIGGGAAVIDGPLPFGDIAGVIIGIGGSAVAGGILIYEKIKTKTEENSKESVGTAEITNTDGTSDTVIYRSGSGNATNLTPRVNDVSGLSYCLNISKAGNYTATTINTVNSTGVLRAVVDGENHVSVIPTNPSKMQEWIDSRPTALASPHEYTEILISISVKVTYMSGE